MEQTLKYNYNEFLAFLLLYASHVDLDFSDIEKNKILKILPQDKYEKIYAQFREMNDYQALQTILEYKGVYYPTPEQKNELIDKVKIQFFSDGQFDSIEKEVLFFLEKLL
jgi:thiosulfate/3-mercaptopyruvate sulfurtransferase